MNRRLLIVLAILIGLIVTWWFIYDQMITLITIMATGWIAYLYRTLPYVHIAWGGVATALISLLLLTAGLHGFLRWFYAESQRQRGVARMECKPWPLRRTTAIVQVVVIMFVAGIAAAGTVHQVGWILNSREPLLRNKSEASMTIGSGRSYYGLLEIGMAARDHHSFDHHSLPSTITDAQGRRLHSWQTVILPYLVRGSRTSTQIDKDLPWNAPENSAYFRGFVPAYLNPEIEATRDADGYALSHYAGNRRVVGRAKGLRPEELGQGLAGTMLAGEVRDGFKPWGDPTNLRDTRQGINRLPGGFGGPSGQGANMLFADGSVRFLDRRTNPEVLEALNPSKGR